ncbi:hypothetical protein RB594_007231 [Gaeumannomyces avenae]
MSDQARIIQEYPIGDGLDSFRDIFRAVCTAKGTPCTSDAFGQLDPKAPYKLRSRDNGKKNLFSDLVSLAEANNLGNLDTNRVKPLLNAILSDHPSDALIWDRVYDAVPESTPPPQPRASSIQQTPWRPSTSSIPNSSEYRGDIDKVLEEELGLLRADLEDFHKTYFGGVQNLEIAAKTFFESCLRDSEPSFTRKHGWKGWPKKATQEAVLPWFGKFVKRLAAFANSYNSAPAHKRALAGTPDRPIEGSIAKRKLDIGFVDGTSTGENSGSHWSQIIVPGELKSNPSADKASAAWLDLGRYAREVLAAQDTRRFVLGFTLCGSLMRIWAFDRLGGIASEQFDINDEEHGPRFVSTILGFLWMTEEELGFDPTIITAKDQRRFIKIEREGTTERLILDKLMSRARCISGRATTCWKAYREGDPDALLVVKDSWQHKERDEEGELLREATIKGAVHVARYYHHETVRVRGMDDDVENNVRRGLDVTKVKKHPKNPPRRPTGTSTASPSRASRSSTSGMKRSSHEAGAFSQPSKRHRSTPSANPDRDSLSNRVHRRIILSDWGRPIYKAGSPKDLLTALADCIEGHESLWLKAGLLHRDISAGNLMISKDNGGFLIDLDLAIQKERLAASGAMGRTGTTVFMAIGVLLGEQHSYMHDLESFFWVLFWICIHYDSNGDGRIVERFDRWNYLDTNTLVDVKRGRIFDSDALTQTAKEHFTPHYRGLVQCVDELREVVFPNGRNWKTENPKLYAQMKEILREASKGL